MYKQNVFLTRQISSESRPILFFRVDSNEDEIYLSMKKYAVIKTSNYIV